MRTYLTILLILGACGGGNGQTGDDQPDAAGNVPAMITLSGVAAEQAQSGTTPIEGVTLAAYRASDDATVIAMATSDAQGMYSLMVQTGGMPLDGYIKATKQGYVDTYLYPPSTLVADFTGADANMLDSTTFALLRGFGGGHAGKGQIALEVQDGAKMPLAGAKVSATPAAALYKYSDDNGLPTGTDKTLADGRAFMFDVPEGNVTITAAKEGATFKSHVLKARPDTFTTTLITQ